MGNDLRLGLIGVGRWGRNFIKTIERMDGVCLHRLASTNPDSPALVGDDCRVTEDWRTIAATDDLDGLIIATPPACHAEMATMAMSSGIPVLIEKPLTLDLSQAGTLLAHAQTRPAIVLVDHLHLYHPAYVELTYQGLGMGAIHAIRSAGGDWGPFRADVSVLWDRASHDVALCLDLMTVNPDRVSAHIKESRETAEGFGEMIALKLTFPGGVTADIDAGNLMDRKKRFLAVHYDHDTLIYDDVCETPLVRAPRPDGPGCEPVRADGIEVAKKAPLTCAVEAFARAIRRGVPDISGLELGTRVVETLTVCEASLRAGGKTLNFRT